MSPVWQAPSWTPFFEVLSLCHTAQIERYDALDDTDSRQNFAAPPTGEEYEYHASSPDEKALLEACRS